MFVAALTAISYNSELNFSTEETRYRAVCTDGYTSKYYGYIAFRDGMVYDGGIREFTYVIPFGVGCETEAKRIRIEWARDTHWSNRYKVREYEI